MWVQFVLTSVFSLGLALALVAKGLPSIAYTIPDRLAVFTEPVRSLGGAPGRGDALAGLRER